VMGSHGRAGVRRALLGSVTERTLRSTHVPILVVDYLDEE
ncbi:universal stress protein, partial [Halorubrum sp. SD626R]